MRGAQIRSSIYVRTIGPRTVEGSAQVEPGVNCWGLWWLISTRVGGSCGGLRIAGRTPGRGGYGEKESTVAKPVRQTKTNRRGKSAVPGRVARNISATMYIRDRGGGRPCRRGSSCSPVVATRLAGAPYTRMRVLHPERSSSGVRQTRARVRVYVCVCVCTRECANTQSVCSSHPPDNNCISELGDPERGSRDRAWLETQELLGDLGKSDGLPETRYVSRRRWRE